MGRRRRLQDATDIRRYVADILLRLDDDAMTPDKGRVLLYGASILRQVVEASDLQTRLERLEKSLEQQK